MARSFVAKNGKIYERFETAQGIAAILVENPSEEQRDDAILDLWGIVGYRVEESANGDV